MKSIHIVHVHVGLVCVGLDRLPGQLVLPGGHGGQAGADPWGGDLQGQPRGRGRLHPPVHRRTWPLCHGAAHWR